MKILDVRRQSGGSTIARFDAELPSGIRLYNLKLTQGQAGLRVYAPSAFGAPAATFTREFAVELIEAVTATLGEIDQHDGHVRAA